MPKRTLKLQVEPKHLDVFLSTVKLIKPRSNEYFFIDLTIRDLEKEQIIIHLNHIYGRFDESNLSEDFELKYTYKSSSFDFVRLHFRNKYEIGVCKGKSHVAHPPEQHRSVSC